MASKTVITIEDVGGSFARFMKQAPKSARKFIGAAVAKTVEHLADEMYDLAPPRSEDPPHIKDAIDYDSRGLSGRAGILEGDESAAVGSKATQADVALYNEYNPNQQPFMRPAAERERKPFTDRVAAALVKVERELSGGL